MSRHVYQLEGQQLRAIQTRAISIQHALDGDSFSNLLAALARSKKDARAIEDLVAAYLEQEPVETDD